MIFPCRSATFRISGTLAQMEMEKLKDGERDARHFQRPGSATIPILQHPVCESNVVLVPVVPQGNSGTRTDSGGVVGHA